MLTVLFALVIICHRPTPLHFWCCEIKKKLDKTLLPRQGNGIQPKHLWHHPPYSKFFNLKMRITNIFSTATLTSTKKFKIQRQKILRYPKSFPVKLYQKLSWYTLCLFQNFFAIFKKQNFKNIEGSNPSSNSSVMGDADLGCSRIVIHLIG